MYLHQWIAFVSGVKYPRSWMSDQFCNVAHQNIGLDWDAYTVEQEKLSSALHETKFTSILVYAQAPTCQACLF